MAVMYPSSRLRIMFSRRTARSSLYILIEWSWLRNDTGDTRKYQQVNSARLSQETVQAHVIIGGIMGCNTLDYDMCLNSFLAQSCAIHLLVFSGITCVIP